MPVTLFCAICGRSFVVTPGRVAKGAKYCDYHCHQIGEGRKGGEVTGSKTKGQGKKSYPKDHSRHLHRVLAERLLGRKLRKKEVVHHIDGNILNNDPLNLAVFPSQSVHMVEHRSEMLAKRKEKHGY